MIWSNPRVMERTSQRCCECFSGGTLFVLFVWAWRLHHHPSDLLKSSLPSSTLLRFVFNAHCQKLMSYLWCIPCDRSFTSQLAPQQHSDQSRAHETVFACGSCDHFRSQQAVHHQHIVSPAHVPIFECDDCERSFNSHRALRQHLSSPAHAPNFECHTCDRSNGSEQSL
jgi:hypothetical protein